ncbi:response regulator transcription factor [Kitasatospora sp. NPDC088346]|uniref:response regulator transcription factor n=1 Tax=Kitasatospora sp. NPDC088346 TaxID=3364073 RepID=UPI00381B2B38
MDGWLALLTGDTAGGELRAVQCDDLALALDHSAGRADADQLAGLAALVHDDFELATALLQRALERYRTLGLAGEVWSTLHLLSLASCFPGDGRAQSLISEGLALSEANGVAPLRLHALGVLALRYWMEQDDRQAVGVLRECLRSLRSGGDQVLVGQCLEVLAWARARAGRHEEAAKHLGAAQRLRREFGSPFASLGRTTVHHAACEDLLRSALGDSAYEAHVRTGAASTPEQAVALALPRSPAHANTPSQAPPPALTRREPEIALLLRQGLSDKQIAARLVISPRTARGHVQRILRRLGFTRRTQVATWIQDRSRPS